jgi:hypothetical protein
MRKSPISQRRLLLTAAVLAVPSLGHAQVAQTPPMGWDSYDSYGGYVNEAQVEANARRRR